MRSLEIWFWQLNFLPTWIYRFLLALLLLWITTTLSWIHTRSSRNWTASSYQTSSWRWNCSPIWCPYIERRRVSVYSISSIPGRSNYWVLSWLFKCTKNKGNTYSHEIRNVSSRSCIWCTSWRFEYGCILEQLEEFMDMGRTLQSSKLSTSTYFRLFAFNFLNHFSKFSTIYSLFSLHSWRCYLTFWQIILLLRHLLTRATGNT